MQRDLAELKGRILVALGQNAGAVPLLRASASESKEKRDIDAALESSTVLVEALIGQADLDSARREWTQLGDAAAAAQAARKPQGLLAMRAGALIDIADGHAGRALTTLNDASAAAVDADGVPTPTLRVIAVSQSLAALANHQWEQACTSAETALRQARAQAVNPESSAWVGEALLLRARCELAGGHRNESRRDAAMALPHLVTNLGATHALATEARLLARE